MEYLYVVKIGGDVVNNKRELDKFLDRFAALKARKILVHGGGRSADQLLQALGIRIRFMEGKRVIEPRVLEVLKQAYSGINHDLTAELQKRQNNAFGFSGVDGGFISAQRRESAITSYGLVGDIVSVKTPIVRALLEAQMVPVIAPLTLDTDKGQILHTNADLIASAIAEAFVGEFRTQLIFSFGLAGVFKNFSKKMHGRSFVAKPAKGSTEEQSEEEGAQLLHTLSHSKYEDLINEELIHGGMLPKLHSGFEALKKGVWEVHVCHSSQIASNGRVCEGTRLLLQDSEDED